MGQRFQITSMRVGGWLRMHDTETGERFEVPVDVNKILRPGDDGEDSRVPDATRSVTAPVEDHQGARTAERKKKQAKRKSNRRSSPLESGVVNTDEKATSAAPPSVESSPWARGQQNPLETQEGRMKPLDEKSLTDADRKVMEDHQKFWAHVQAVTSKRGGLGWEETTDAGRSGLRARYKSGVFKILHAGGDTYALFYEWDSGKFEKIACGKAEELMALAQQRTRDKLPPPPRTVLDLEMARHMCASDPEQRRIAADRLAPIFRELEIQEKERQRNEADPPPSTRRHRSPKPVPPPTAPAPASPDASPAANAGVDAQRDASLMASFSQALAEMEE